MEKKDPNDDGKKATNRPSSPIGGHAKPLFKQNGWTGHDGRGEEDVINRCDYRGVKDVEGFIKVADLDADADHEAYEQGPEERIFEYSRSPKQLFDADAEAFHAGHRQWTNHRADEDVHQNILLTIARRDKDNQDQAAHDNANSKRNKSWGSWEKEMTKMKNRSLL